MWGSASVCRCGAWLCAAPAYSIHSALLLAAAQARQIVLRAKSTSDSIVFRRRARPCLRVRARARTHFVTHGAAVCEQRCNRAQAPENEKMVQFSLLLLLQCVCMFAFRFSSFFVAVIAAAAAAAVVIRF